MAVKGNGGVGADAFKLQEVAFTLLFLCDKVFLVCGFAVEIAVA